MFSRFGRPTIPACDGQTDRRTDGHTPTRRCGILCKTLELTL